MTNFAEIDANKIASPKQIWAVANKFATIVGVEKSERFGLVKVFNAILNSMHGESKLTHGDIQEFFELEVVPSAILSRVKSKDAPKPKKVSKKKAKAKPEPEVLSYLERTAKAVKPVKKVAENSNVKKINARIDLLETKIDKIESGLTQILETIAPIA